MRNVDVELDRNMASLLQNHVYIPFVEFIEINLEKNIERFVDEKIKDNNQKTNYNRNLIRGIIVDFFKASYATQVSYVGIGQTNIPDKYFYVGYWFGGRRMISEIGFEVIKSIDDLYIKMDRINIDISYLEKTVAYSSTVNFNNVNRIQLAIKSIENNLSAILKDEIQNVKSKIRDEIDRLKKELENVG